jgi:N-terminal region of Chorein or VPS13
MFSPKKYLEELLSALLAEWADSFDDTHVNIGLWNGGDVQLSNLVLKKRSFNIGHDLQVYLDIGTGI